MEIVNANDQVLELAMKILPLNDNSVDVSIANETSWRCHIESCDGQDFLVTSGKGVPAH